MIFTDTFNCTKTNHVLTTEYQKIYDLLKESVSVKSGQIYCVHPYLIN